MIKVLIVGMTDGVGGVETFICNIKKHISDEIKMDFLMHQEINDRYKNDILKNDSQIYKVYGIKDGILKYLRSIFKFYKEHKYDVVHINECDAKMFLYGLPLLFDNKTKVIIHSHSTSAKNVFVHKILKFFQNRRANIKWACSDVAFDYMFGLKDTKKIIHNGIDLNVFRYDEEIEKNKRRELNLKNEIVFCSVARFTKEKNHQKIIDIFHEYHKINTNSKLILVGTGPLQEKIKNKVKELNIDGDVLFLNSRTDVNEILSMTDVFLLPSLFEGLPFVSLEGQASSVLFFASNNVSKEIAITDLVHFIDLDESSEQWAEKISKVLENKINRKDKKYQEEIRKAGYDINNVCHIIEKEYKRT